MGAADQIDNLFNSIAAIGNGVNAAFRNESFADAVVKTNASDTFRLFENLGLQDWIIDFESRYTDIRDLNGNYSGFGAIAGQVGYSLGQLAPSMFLGKVAGSAARSTGASISAVSTVQKVTSSLVFYQGATAGNVREIYKQMANDEVTPSSAAILANASIKSAVEYAVEVGLAKLLGGSTLDAMVFGRNAASAVGKSLTKATAYRVFGDFVEEGLEEIFQDTATFLVDRAFNAVLEANFGKLTDLSWQSLMDAFLVGGLASFAGSAMNIIGTRRVRTSTIVDGEIKTKKLNKLASWEYGLSYQSFVQNFIELEEQGKSLLKNYDETSGKKYAAAFAEMYSAYRMISSIYNEIGDERFKAANDVLAEIDRMINSGKFSNNTVKLASEEIYKALYMLDERNIEGYSRQMALKKLEQARITKTVTSIERGQDDVRLDVSDATKQELEKMLSADSNLHKIVLTEDGNNVVTIGGTMFVPINYMINANAEIVFATVAEQKLVEGVMNGKYKGLPLENVHALFKHVTGRDNATLEEAVYNLVFNDSFFKIVLSTSTKDVFNFVSSIIDIEQDVVPNNLRDAIYNQKIRTATDKMKASLIDYLSNQQNAEYRFDYFTTDQQRKIAATRWCKDLYNRVINDTAFKKLTEEDWTVLTNRVNSLTITKAEKNKLIKNLHSTDNSTRQAAMNRIANAYANIFTTPYDGRTYMPDNSVPNRTFNQFLREQGLTIKTLMSIDDNIKQSVTTVYGEFNEGNLLKFRQTQFSKACNNRFTFRFNSQGKLGVFEATTNKQVGFAAYNAQADSLLSPAGLDKRTTIERSSKKNHFVKKLLNSSVDAATAAYLSIDDVINDPSVLNEQHLANIQLKYGEVNIENTFLYLRDYFLNETELTTVIALADGSYAFGNVRPMTAALKSQNIKIDNRTTISHVIKPAYLYGRLKNTKIKLTKDPIVAEYRAGENTIYINSHLAEKGGDLLKFAFLHEFQHAIQVENGMNIGMNAAWLQLKSLSKSAKANIIADVRKHRPELFENVAKNSEDEAKIVNDFVYFSSGESTAIGIDASNLLDFYPTIVRQTQEGTSIQFPWGTKHAITGNSIPLSLVTQFGDFDIHLSEKEHRYYKALAFQAHKEMTSDNADKQILSRFEGSTYDDFVNDFLKILAVSDDRKFITDLYWYLADNLRYNVFAEHNSEYEDELAECKYLANKRLSELELFAKGIQDVDKVADVKSYTPVELKELFFKYNTDIAIEQFAKNVFYKFETLSSIFGSDVKVTNWHSKIRPGSAGFVYRNLIRYSADEINSSRRTRTPELLLHEVLHFVTEPLIQVWHIDEYILSDDIRNCIQQLQYLLNHEVSKFESTPYKHRVSDVSEFVAGRAHRSFVSELKKTSDALSATLKRTIEQLVGQTVNTYYDAYIALIDTLLSYTEIGGIYRAYYNTYTAKYYTYTYPDTHGGKTEIVYSDSNGEFYRIDDNNQRIYMNDARFELVEDYQTSLGPTDSQSLKANNEAEAALYKSMTDAADSLIKANKQITTAELERSLQEKFPFAPNDVISELVSETLGDARKELEELNKSVTIDKTESKEISPRASKQNVRSKTATAPKKRYVSQKKSAGTNLEKFGYVAKYKRTQLSPELQSFIVNATKDIDKTLWEKVQSGKLTTQDIMDYFRNSKTIDDKTFKLINNSFFHNSKIKTFKQLQEYILFKTPKYYAMRALVKSLGYGNLLMSNTNPNLLDNFVQVIEKDAELKKLYDQIVDRYYSYQGNEIVISEKNLRRLWMKYFDGSAQTAGYLATIAKAGAINKWIITGEGSSKARKSLDESIEDDIELGDTIADTGASDAFAEIFYSSSREERIEEIMKIVGPRYLKKLMSKGMSKTQAAKKFNEKWSQLREMDDKEFTKQYAIIVKDMSEEEINNLFAKQLIAESAGIDVSKLNDKELEKLTIVTEKTIPEAQRPATAIVNNLRSIARTIKSNLSAKDATRFLKENSDIFTDKLTIKSDVIKQKNDKGVEEFADIDALLSLEERVRKLSKDVRANVYQSQRSLDFKKQMEREIAKLEKRNAKLVDDIAKGKGMQPITYEVADNVLTIDTSREIPPALERILATNFDKVGKSKIKYLVEGDTDYIRTSWSHFIKENAEYLQTLSQADVDAIVDFYLNSEIIPGTNKAGIYSAIQVYLIGYLIKGNRIGQFTLTEEQSKALSDRMDTIVRVSARNLANWQEVRKQLKPEEIIIQSLAKSSDIEFAIEDVENLVAAVESGDIERIQNAKTRMYENGIANYKGRKRSILRRLLAFERMAMLSGPGTIIRNKITNPLVTTGNLYAERVGATMSSVIEKLFPKKKWQRDKQYKLVGTKVTSEVQTFIKTHIIDSGFFKLVKDGTNRYDVRKFKSDESTSEEALSNLVIRSIKAKIFQKGTFDSEILNKAQAAIFKLLSDDKSIDKATIRYFGKMLVEDNVDLSKGLNNLDVINCFAEAYKLAAHDYMHKTNFFTKVEGLLQEKFGETGYFMYKQLFPFAASSWNWFAEGFNYTPIGLVKAIVNFAKLENTIEKMDIERQHGEQVVSSRFAEYLARRKIGKGVIGSVGTAIGIALAALGFAGIDDEDDKLKLFVRIGDEEVYVDISDVFGTQGILLGIAIATPTKDGDWLSAVAQTLTTMFDDSTFSDLFNTFRYSDSFGDWLVSQPYAFLNMFIPNFLKTLSSIANVHKVKYSSGIKGKFEKLAVNAIPGLAYAFPTQIDPYTGEKQLMYKMQFVTNLANKLLPLKIHPYNVSDIEKEAISVGVKKGALTGNYTVNGEKVKLSAAQTEALNEYYGGLNKESLTKLMSNKTAYKVWDETKGKYVELKYNRMSDAQKKTVIERIMSDNGQIAKVYILTSSGNWKYYASESEYKELKKLGLKNVYKNTDKLDGFVAN